MSLLPAIPREPPARLRLMSLWFALFAIAVDTFEIAIGQLASLEARLTGIAALGILVTWIAWGYRRGRFPEYSTVVEAILLVAITAGSSLPLRSMGLFLAVIQLRSLYVTRREFLLLPISYGIARAAGMALTPQPAPYGPLSQTVVLQFIGLVFISVTLFMLMQALEGQARAEAQLREVQKMEAVGQLAGGIAHDFNNLLTVIGGHVYMLETSEKLGPEATRHLAGITQTTERAGSLTRQLLAFGRRQLLHPTTVDLNAVVRDATRLLEPVVGERIRVVTDLDPNPPHVHADVGQLEQVLLNLGLNARDAMPSGGELRISTSTVETSGGRQACVTFADSGVGMDESTLSRVFEPFFTTKRAGRGTGLGLATAYGIVKQSGGDITVSSEPGKGATFRITLPIVVQPPVSVPRGFDLSPVVPGGLRLKRILLVEDNDGVRNFVRAALTAAGGTVITAADGAEGLAVARAEGYAFDLVLTDVVMPGLNGPQMVQRLREACPELPVLFMTGYADDPATRQELSIGREALIEKPFTARALLDAVHSIAVARASVVPSAGSKA